MKTVQPPRFSSFLNTIRGRLVLLALLALFPALAVQVFGAWRDLRGDIEARKLESSRALIHATSDFAALLGETRTVIADLVRVNEVRSAGNCTQVFTALRFAYERLAPEAVNLGLADAEGHIYCAINPVQGQRSLARTEAFRSAVATSDMAAGSYALNPASGPPLILVTSPVLSFDGQVQTVIFVTFATRWLERWQSESALPGGSAVTLLATNGVPLWRTVDGQPVSLAAADREGVAWLPDLRAGGPAVEGPDLDGARRLHTVVPLQHQGQIVGYLHLGYPLAQLYAATYRDLGWQLALLSLVLAGTLAIAWQGSERFFLSPLRGLMAAVQRVQAGDLAARVTAVRGLGEVNALAHAFDRMADALQQREAERRQIEARFRAAFESSAIGMGLLTLDGWILAANASVCQMSGFTEAELKQRNDRDNVYPPDADVGMDLFEEMLAGKRGYYSVEKRYLRKNGDVFWVRLTLSLVRDAAGQPAYLVGMVENIDDQKRESAALAESEARFRTMFETSAIGIGIMGLDRRVISANPALCQMYGYRCEELIGQTSVLVIHPDDYPRSVSSLQDLLAGRLNQFSDERRYVRKNGEVFWARIVMSMVRDAQGAPLYIVGMVADINEQRLAMAKLQESEARFRAMYNNAAVGMAMMSPDRRILSVNETSARITGYSVEELLNTDPIRLSHPDDVAVGMAQFGDLVAGRISQFQMEKRFLRKNGQIFWGRVSYSAVPGKDGRPEYLVGLIEDISEECLANERLAAQEAEHRRLLEQRIAERTEELSAANERLREKAAQDAVTAERTRLARDLHDAVTQTLFSTTLIAEVLPDLWALDPAEGRRRLEELRQLTRGALAEMRTLLVELRPNALTEVPLPTLLRQLSEGMVSRARIAIQLSAEGERKLPADVQVGLYRIAQEALSNVTKHAKATQAVVTLRLGETVRLTVADNGAGFDPGAVTADHLGLRIMRERAEAIGARLSVYSEPGEGTQVSVVWGKG